ncbi:hypothetical protein ES705_27968 [subsurface metagenome]
MQKLTLLLLIFFILSCDKSLDDLNGHWHIHEIEREIISDTTGTPFEIHTIDINDLDGECNKYSFNAIKANVRQDTRLNRLIISSDIFDPLILKYQLYNDSIVLKNLKGHNKYSGYRIDIDSCNMTYHRFERFTSNIKLPYIPDSIKLNRKEINWENSNCILVTTNYRAFGRIHFNLVFDEYFAEINQLSDWYNYLVLHQYDKIRVFTDSRQRLCDIKLLISEIKKLPCDSIYFGFTSVQDNYTYKDIDWISNNDLYSLIPESELYSLESLKSKGEQVHITASKNWLYELSTTANNIGFKAQLSPKKRQ